MYLPNGTLLRGGQYEIVRFISSGGFGCTYEALDVGLNKCVAIKEFFVKDFCNRDGSTSHVTIATKSKEQLILHLRDKFMKEARTMANLEHDNIVDVKAVFEENGTSYYVMDYVDGKSVSAVLKDIHKYSEKDALAIIRKVCSALKYMHECNCYHLDVKPGNIMVRKDGKVLLIDFGSSKQYTELDGENTTTMAPCYTPGYAPVEQMNSRVVEFTAATDIYSLGATLYKMLTGITPPSAIDLQSDEATLPLLPANISSSTRNAVMRAMETKRKNRPQSIDEFLDILDNNSQTTNGGDDTFTPGDSDGVTVRLDGDTVYVETEKERVRRIAKERFEAERKAKAEAEAKKAEAEAREKKRREEEAAIQAEMERLRKEEEKKKNYREEKDAVYFRIEGKEYKMVKVAGGTFDMKETVSSGFLGLSSKEIVQKTTLSDYYIGEKVVTQRLWMDVMGENPSRFKGDNLPVEMVSWNDCQEFIKKLNLITGKCFCLPTEAEWEFAARGGKKSRGYKYSGSNNIGAVAWYDDNSGCKTHPVATKQANELGIYDMSGNVWEWCSDWYGNYNSTAQNDPIGPNCGSRRVFRGGGWLSHARFCRVSFRGSSTPDYRNYDLGLRLVLRPSVQ